MSKKTEIIVKIPDTIVVEKTLCPFHPGVAKPMRESKVPTLIITKIKMSTIRSLVVGCMLAQDAMKIGEMMTDIFDIRINASYLIKFYVNFIIL
jgi:hypothetical protein